MVIQFASDLHLEFSVNKKYIDKQFLNPTGQILLLAGDIVPFAKKERAHNFLQRVSDNYEQVYWVPGNHEYYYADIPSHLNPTKSFEEKIRPNVTLLNNLTIELEKVRLIFSTFWSHIPENEMPYLKKGMADFSLIKDGKIPINCDQYNSWHEKAFHFLNRELAAPTNKKTIVVTHHVPTFFQYPEEFVGSSISAGFATEYHDYIATSHIDYWIFGHHHRNVAPFTIGQTQMLTNQLGYVWYDEHAGFKEGQTIIID